MGTRVGHGTRPTLWKDVENRYAKMLKVSSPKLHKLHRLLAALDDIMAQSHNFTQEGSAAGEAGSAVSAGRGKQAAHYDALAQNMAPSIVCETGFNAGHSAARFLVHTEATVYEFDLGEYEYARKGEAFLAELYPERLQVIWGDSTKTMPTFIKEHPEVKCEIMVVDGGHSLDVAVSDIYSFSEMASEDHVLIVDDTPCDQEWCDGPTEAWNAFVEAGCLEKVASISMTPSMGYRVGTYLPCTKGDAVVRRLQLKAKSISYLLGKVTRYYPKTLLATIVAVLAACTLVVWGITRKASSHTGR